MAKNSKKVSPETSPRTSSPKIGVVVLGSTGSIGTQTLQVLKKHKDKFAVIGLACHNNEKLLAKQAKEFKVPKSNTVLASKNPKKITALIKNKSAEIIVNAIAGSAGLKPSITTLKASKILALANKESVVLAGKTLTSLAKKHNAKILPLDSEHHAVARILKSQNLTKFDHKKISKITITCSGGPFFGWSKKRLAKATIKDAMKHPTWRMGPKITIESATLLNKGYELIEAHHLFACPLKNIDAIIDRKSYIHAIVEFKDARNVIALAYSPDMRTVIEDTLLNYPKSNPKLKFLTGKQLASYKFHKINHKTFPAIEETIKAYNQNHLSKFFKQKEKNIALFLENKIKFTQI